MLVFGTLLLCRQPGRLNTHTADLSAQSVPRHFVSCQAFYVKPSSDPPPEAEQTLQGVPLAVDSDVGNSMVLVFLSVALRRRRSFRSSVRWPRRPRRLLFVFLLCSVTTKSGGGRSGKHRLKKKSELNCCLVKKKTLKK